MKRILSWFAGLIADEIKKRLLEANVKATILKLEPGDKIILRCPKVLSDSAHMRLKEQVEEMFPGHRAVVLEEGLDIKVARTQKERVALAPDDRLLEKLFEDCVVENASD